jgi:hypothetical protein
MVPGGPKPFSSLIRMISRPVLIEMFSPCP